MAGHTEGAKKELFCSVRAETCECGNKYRAPCDATAAGWDASPAALARGLAHKVSQYAQRYAEGANWRSHEAHHIACVAAVTDKITCNTNLEEVVKITKWCVNDASNMIALPLWPHTLHWYVDMFGAGMLADMLGGELQTTVGPPPFAGLAHHDYDHGRYIKEVNGELTLLAERVQKALDKHAEPSSTLASGLARIICDYQSQLRGRNTHEAWKNGMNEPDGDWYKSFSMAKSGNASARAFPIGKNRMGKKIAEIREAFLKLASVVN